VKNAYNILVGKHKGVGPCRRHRHKGDNNINLKLRDEGCERVDWLQLAQDRV